MHSSFFLSHELSQLLRLLAHLSSQSPPLAGETGTSSAARPTANRPAKMRIVRFMDRGYALGAAPSTTDRGRKRALGALSVFPSTKNGLGKRSSAPRSSSGVDETWRGSTTSTRPAP